MSFTSLDSMGKTSLMLDLISQRQRALGANIANVDTPGYVRRDIDFSQYLGNMNSPIETKLSTALGPSGVIEDRRNQEIDIAEELAERASDQLREFEKSVECLGNELNGTRSKLEQARDSYRRSSDTLDRLRIAVNGIEETSRRAEEIARRYDELDSETERILQELLRRAGTKAVFAEDAEHNTDSIHSDSLRHSGDSSHPKLKEE